MSCETAGRCAGQCCKVFYLPATPAELASIACMEEVPARPTLTVLEEGGAKWDAWPASLPRDPEAPAIARMAIHLASGVAELRAKHPELAALFTDTYLEANAGSEKRPAQWYTCKNHDAATGDCTIYETRPQMCRQFPYNERCFYGGCTAPVEPRVLEYEARRIAMLDKMNVQDEPMDAKTLLAGLNASVCASMDAAMGDYQGVAPFVIDDQGAKLALDAPSCDMIECMTPGPIPIAPQQEIA